jgi:hypothetical protein
VTASVGTSLTLELAVYDSAGANATAKRTITVVSPCPELGDDGSVVSPDATFYCPDTAADGTETGSYVCSAISCEDRRRLASATGAGSNSAVLPPRLFLLPFANAANLSQVWTVLVQRASLRVGCRALRLFCHCPQAERNQAVFLPYGQPAGISLAPCASFAAGTNATSGRCAAIANDTSAGDVTSSIIATVEGLCDTTDSLDGGTVVACPGCTVVALTTGACLPGRYRIIYTAGGAGGSTSRSVDVAVEQVCYAGFCCFALSLLPLCWAGYP